MFWEDQLILGVLAVFFIYIFFYLRNIVAEYYGYHLLHYESFDACTNRVYQRRKLITMQEYKQQ